MKGLSSLMRLLIHAERGTWARLVINGVAMPLLIAYLLSRLEPQEGFFGPRAAGALAFCLGGAMTQSGHESIRDRFHGRLRLVQTVLPSAWTYGLARILLGVTEATLVAAFFLLMLGLTGTSLSVTAVGAVLASVALGAFGLCAVAFGIAQRIRSPEAAMSTIGIAAMVFGASNPALYREGTLPSVALTLSPYAHVARQFKALVEGSPPPVGFFPGAVAMALVGAAIAVYAVRRGVVS